MKIRELSLMPSSSVTAILKVRVNTGEFSIGLPINGVSSDGTIDMEAAVLQDGLDAAISALGAWAGA